MRSDFDKEFLAIHPRQDDPIQAEDQAAPDQRLVIGAGDFIEAEVPFALEHGHVRFERTHDPSFGQVRKSVDEDRIRSDHDERDSWKLVHFIRHLPQLTVEEKKEMEKLNPKNPDELREEEEEKKFLEGADANEHQIERHRH